MSNQLLGLSLQLPTGWIEGIDSAFAGDTESPSLRIFKGIPFAEAPIGDLRWKAPQPVKPWVGVRTCDRFGSVAAQAALPGFADYAGDLDCLHLNVWCPPTGDGPWPVMVWIPGGGFMRGGASDALYDGSAMARQGIVFVSINYRLGVDGFMHFEDAAPNRGLQDQMAALRWVQKHIVLFGGDARRVTVAGASAGAGAITHLMGLSDSDDLFDRVILQSPSMQSHNLDDAQRIRHALAGVLGVAPTRHALSAVPLASLTRALASFLGNDDLKNHWGLRPKNYFPVRPVIDGQLLELEPLQAIEKHLQAGGPARAVLLGFNAEEMRFYHVPNGAIDRIDEAKLLAFSEDIGWPSQLLAQRLSEYRAVDPDMSMGDALCCIQSDYFYGQPTLALERLLHQANCPTFFYRFEWSSPLYGGRLGAAHAMEIPFVLGNTHLSRAQEFIGAVAPADLAKDMHTRWANFVRGDAMPDWACEGQRLRIFSAHDCH
jgi:para-nitrobenzyl esterase